MFDKILFKVEEIEKYISDELDNMIANNQENLVFHHYVEELGEWRTDGLYHLLFGDNPETPTNTIFKTTNQEALRWIDNDASLYFKLIKEIRIEHTNLMDGEERMINHFIDPKILINTYIEEKGSQLLPKIVMNKWNEKVKDILERAMKNNEISLIQDILNCLQ